MSDAMIGYLAKYEIQDGAGWFEVGEVIDMNPGEETGDRVDVTHFKSPDRRREYIAGLIDPGEASFQINWVPGNPTDVFLRGLKSSGEKRIHRITFPNGAAVEYDGMIQSMSKVTPIDDRMTATITVAVSGAETWSDPAAPTNGILPAISGIAQVGQTLTVYPGQWNFGGTFTYQWQEDDSGWGNISGATGKTYVPVVGNVGNPLRVVVTATNSQGSASANSAATADVIAA